MSISHFVLLALLAQAQAPETPAQRDARMAWWRDAQFGIVIHWGAYAVPAGTHKGERIAGIGEWIMSRAHIPISEYDEYVHRFNPTRFDPDARQTHARYRSFTSCTRRSIGRLQITSLKTSTSIGPAYPARSTAARMRRSSITPSPIIPRFISTFSTGTSQSEMWK